MAVRNRYLVLYDISNPGRLRRIHQIAVDFGEQLQYSAYICDLTRRELIGMRARLRDAMHQRKDRISIFNLGPAAAHDVKAQHLGRRSPAYRDSTDDAVVW